MFEASAEAERTRERRGLLFLALAILVLVVVFCLLPYLERRAAERSWNRPLKPGQIGLAP